MDFMTINRTKPLLYNLDRLPVAENRVSIIKLLSSLIFRLAIDLHQSVLNHELGVRTGPCHTGRLQRLAQPDVIVPQFDRCHFRFRLSVS